MMIRAAAIPAGIAFGCILLALGVLTIAGVVICDGPRAAFRMVRGRNA